MLNPNTLAAVETLRPLLRQLVCGEYGVAVGGAHAKHMDDEESDLDLYVFAGGILPNPERTRLTLQLSPDVRDVVSYGCLEPFEQAGTDFFLGTLKIECWFRNTASLDHALDEGAAGIVRQDLVTWTTTGFFNHCSLSDLNSMVPVEDPTGLLARWKDRVRRYPPRLRASIIERHLGAARFWPGNFHYRSAVERRDVIYTTGIVQQVVHNLIQVLFAANRAYFPGDKKLASAIASLDLVPDRFAERVQGLLFPGRPVNVEVLRDQQRELQDLLKAVEGIVSRTSEPRGPSQE